MFDKIKELETYEAIVDFIFNYVFEVYDKGDGTQGLYLRQNKYNKDGLSKTVGNVIKKIVLRYQLDTNYEDSVNHSIMIMNEVFLLTYAGRIRLNEINVNIPKVILESDYQDFSEIKNKLMNESVEEREYRLEQFKKLFTEDNLSKYLPIFYNACTQNDFNGYFKTNKNQDNVIVKYPKLSLREIRDILITGDRDIEVSAKIRNVIFSDNVTDEELDRKITVKEYEAVYRDSLNVTYGDTEMDSIDYFYSKSSELQEKCINNVQNGSNNTNGLFGYLLENYKDKLTKKQRDFLDYVSSLNLDDYELKSFFGNSSKRPNYKYDYRMALHYKNQIADTIYNLAKDDEKLVVKPNNIRWSNRATYIDTVRKILNEKNMNNQVDILVSVLKKDNKTAQIITEHLIDKDLYHGVCKYIIGEISYYKFSVVYFKKILKALEELVTNK